MKVALDGITNWILVTGMIRSGTTFVGKVLSMPVEVDYIHEPFGKDCGIPGYEEMSLQYIRPKLDAKAAEFYRSIFSPLFTYDFTLKTSRYSGDSVTRRLVKTIVGSRGPFYLRLAKCNPFHKAAVIKDPAARFAAEYLHVNHGVTPVIMVRHPVSVVASLRRLNWWPGLRKLAAQPHLVQDYFANERSFIIREWPDLISGAAAHWRATYKVLLGQASKYPDWKVLTHEELSQDPARVFERLYDTFELPWTRSIERRVHDLTRNNGSAVARTGRVQDFRRNSADIFETYRDSVSKEVRRDIYEIVKDVALDIYPRETFKID